VDKDDSLGLEGPNAIVPAAPTLSVSEDSHWQVPTHVRSPKRRREEFTGSAPGPTESTVVNSTLVEQHPPPQCKFNAGCSKGDIVWLYMLIFWAGTLTGDVFKLTIDEVKEVIETDQVGSEIFLTWPHYLQTAPFITVPVSNSIALGFAWKPDCLQGQL